jgi:hypothetical protein
MSSVSTGGAQTPPHVLPPPPAIVVQERFVAFHFKLAFSRLGVAYQLFFPLSKTFFAGCLVNDHAGESGEF